MSVLCVGFLNSTKEHHFSQIRTNSGELYELKTLLGWEAKRGGPGSQARKERVRCARQHEI